MTADKVDIHGELCNEMHKLYVRKNADYGDSFSKVRMDIPNAILVRLSDKLNRLKSLMNSESERRVNDESIDDTLMDLANYCLLELVERRCDEYDRNDQEDTWDYACRIADEIDKEKKVIKDSVEYDLSGMMSPIRTVVTSQYDQEANGYFVNTRVYCGTVPIENSTRFYIYEDYKEIFEC